MYRPVEQHAFGLSDRRFLGAVIEKLQQRMREGDRATMRPFRTGFMSSNRVDQIVRSRVIARILKHSPGPSRIDARMIIRTRDKRLQPRSIAFWRNAVFVGKTLDRL